MTIEQAIKKSIEGGYDCQGITKNPDSELDIDYETQRDGSKRVIVSTKRNVSAGGYRELIQEKIFLDSNFWKCLGKSLGWETEADYYGRWLAEWHCFIDFLAEGKSAEDYFKELK
ncbi:hypothetical protein LCGC14_2593440 [marine sediment metagenome]|uniref:Uncharacterized protein n=1 Tax=marine sediment metagenome TaxID=412755 RepID=A0A0F9AYY4_9ZZZZ